jgi:isoleucyl-tRNA synthetase
VHLTEYPRANPDYIDKNLEEEMGVVIDLVSLGRTARNTCQIKVRQTLQAIYVPEKYKETVLKMEGLNKEEINIKEISFIQSRDRLVQYKIKPNFKTMGPKYGKHMKQISARLEESDANALVDHLQSGEAYYLDIEGNTITITEEDVLVTFDSKEGFVFETMKDKYVALDINLTPELIQEGYAREIVNKVQFTRKELDFDIMDNIEIKYYSDDELAEVFDNFAEYIKNETLALNIVRLSEQEEGVKLIDINDKEAQLVIVRLKTE